MKILGICGGLREKSTNAGLLRAFGDQMPDGIEFEIASIRDLPLYNQDLDENYPEAATKLKEQIEAADAVIFATPEFNRSIPGSLKTAIDWASRPYKSNSFEGKTALVISTSPGGAGGAMAQQHLKNILLHLNMNVLGQPEFWVGGGMDKFDENGNLTDEKTREFITVAIAALIERNNKS